MVFVAGTAVGSLTTGISATLTLNAVVNAGMGGSIITNTATVTGSDQADFNTGNNTSSLTLNILAPPAPSADLSLSDDFLGSDLSYARFFGQVNYFRPVARVRDRRMLWAQSVRVGYARAFQGQELLVDEL